MTELYQPKGGMCATCKDMMNNCTSLDFKNMPVIDNTVWAGIKIHVVKCTNFERINETKVSK